MRGKLGLPPWNSDVTNGPPKRHSDIRRSQTHQGRACHLGGYDADNGTLVETYLAVRGLHLPLPPTLRFHTGLKHASGGFWPAMVALVTRGVDDLPLAIHRTFLARDGLARHRSIRRR